MKFKFWEQAIGYFRDDGNKRSIFYLYLNANLELKQKQART